MRRQSFLLLTFVCAVLFGGFVQSQDSRLLSGRSSPVDYSDFDRRFSKAKRLGIVDSLKEIHHSQQQCLDHENMEVGEEGWLDGWLFSVRQVIDAKNVIVGINNPRLPALWISDYDTKGLADKADVRITGVVKAIEPKSYTAVIGAKMTVPAIRFLSEAEAKEFVAKEKEKQTNNAFRTWTLAAGAEIGEFQMVEAKNNFVTLKAKDGSTKKVDFRKLSDDDKDFVLKKSGIKKR